MLRPNGSKRRPSPRKRLRVATKSATPENGNGSMPRVGARGKSALRARALGAYESLFWQDYAPGVQRELLMAALESFAEVGFHGTSTREIAKRAGVSSAAMYAHYKSKEEVLFRIAHVMASNGYDQVREVAAIPGTPAERLARIVRTDTAFHARMAAAARVTNYEIHALTPAHRKLVLECYEGTRLHVLECVTEGVKRRAFVVSDVRTVVTAIMSLILAVCRWYSPEGELTPEQLGDRYADLVLKMLGANQTKLGGRRPSVARRG